MAGRGPATRPTRSTPILATVFMLLSLTLAVMTRGAVTGGGHDILAGPPPAASTPVPPAAPTPAPHN